MTLGVDETTVARLMNRIRRLADALGYADHSGNDVLLEITQDEAFAIMRCRREQFNYLLSLPDRNDWALNPLSITTDRWPGYPTELPPLRIGEWITIYGVRLVWLGK